MTESSRSDVVIIGGGPGGSTVAGLLARAGHAVTLLEREHFPRYHIGESLLSATLPLLEELGVREKVEAAGFIKKPGGTFVWGCDSEPWQFYFRDDPGGEPYAFQVLRSDFDTILLRHAQSLGADVREGARVVSVDRSGAQENVVRAFDDSGGSIEVQTRFVVDASGQSGLLSRREGWRQMDPFLKNLALFAYFDDVETLTGGQAGNIFSVAFAEGWSWLIPLHDGSCSVGVVVDADRHAADSAKDPSELYHRLLNSCPKIAERLTKARPRSQVRVVRDYSYSSRSFYGPDFLLVGDAACFIDPLFSTGVHLACLAGYFAFDALHEVLGGADATECFPRFDRRYAANLRALLELSPFLL